MEHRKTAKSAIANVNRRDDKLGPKLILVLDYIAFCSIV